MIANTISNGSLTVPVNGHVNTVLDATFENKSGKTINKLELTADGNKFTFTDLGLGWSDTLTISLRNGGKAILDARNFERVITRIISEMFDMTVRLRYTGAILRSSALSRLAFLY